MGLIGNHIKSSSSRRNPPEVVGSSPMPPTTFACTHQLIDNRSRWSIYVESLYYVRMYVWIYYVVLGRWVTHCGWVSPGPHSIPLAM